MMTRTIRALAASAALTLALTVAAHSQPPPVAPAAESFHLGKLEVVALRDGGNALPNDGKVFGADAGPAAVAEMLAKAGAPTDKIMLSVDALLVKAPDRVMLFDTGLGPRVHGALMDSLAKAGVAPAAVTDIFITHSHGDHVGGLTAADGGLAFPNAVIHISALEWASLQSRKESQTLVDLIKPKVRAFEPGSAIVPGVTGVALYGHTPGHTGYEIVSGKDRLLDVGDIVHSSILSLAKPDWQVGFDGDKPTAAALRRATLTRLAASHELIFAPHFPYPGVGRITAAGDGFAWAPQVR